ncbi:hypothetical protein LINGRAHAP2_LOCUS35235 [Linum grandiflorum]
MLGPEERRTYLRRIIGRKNGTSQIRTRKMLLRI